VKHHAHPDDERGVAMPAAAHEAHEHDRHAGHSVAMFRNKFWVSLVLTVPILIWGHMLPRLFGYPPLHLPGATWVIPLLGMAVFAYGGWPFVVGAVHELSFAMDRCLGIDRYHRTIHPDVRFWSDSYAACRQEARLNSQVTQSKSISEDTTHL
jgi:cation transport ATPase